MKCRIVASVASVYLLVGLASAQDVVIDDDGSKFTINDRGQPVMTYVYLGQPPVDKGPSGPSNFFHPVQGLYGETVTGEAPSNWSGAPGISWGWTRMGVAGRAVDLERGDGAHVEFERVLVAKSTAAGAFAALQYVWLTDPDGQARIIQNISFSVGKFEDGQRIIDLAVVLRCVTNEVVYLEGGIPGAGLAFQLSDEREDWSVGAAPGDLAPADVPYLSPWAVCSYRDDRHSTRSGIAIFQDSRNPGFADANWRVEAPNRVVAGVPSSVKAELKPGQTLEFRYRLILYHLGASRVDLTRQYAEYMTESLSRK